MELLSEYNAWLRCVLTLLLEGSPWTPPSISPSNWQARSSTISTFFGKHSLHVHLGESNSNQNTSIFAPIYLHYLLQPNYKYMLFCEEASP